MKNTELARTTESSSSYDKYEPNPMVSYDQVPGHILVPKDNIPNLILMITPCRSGSTIQHRVFGASGIPSFQHPSKAILRNLMHNQKWDFRVPELATIFVKETVGPYTQKESKFNALEAFLAAGYPPEKIHALIFIREPLACATSWDEQFASKRGGDVIFHNFLTTYRTVDSIDKYAEENRVQTTHYIYESLKENPAPAVVRPIFERLKVKYTDKSVGGWSALPRFGKPGSNIEYSSEPDIYAGGFHDVAESANELSFFPKSKDKIDSVITKDRYRAIKNSGLFDIYKNMSAKSQDELSIRISPSREELDYLARD